MPRDRGRPDELPIPDDVTADQLDPQVRAELRSLSRPVADQVARRLVAAGELVDDEPDMALQHAVAARRLASRIGVVREAVGIAAYHAGQWQTALSEIRTYHRISGKQTHLAVLADCERALGRPEKAVDIYRSSAGNRQADSAEAIELLIVAAGARRDLGQDEAALAMLQVRELTANAPWTARLRYAYADTLFDLGRRDEAREWFARAVDADPEAETDAAERLLDLDGVELEEAGEDEDPELALAIAHDETEDRADAEPAPGRGDTAAAASATPDEEGLDDEEFDDLDDDEDLEELDDDDDDDEFDDDDDLDDDEDDEVDDEDEAEEDDDLDEDEDVRDDDAGAEWEDYVPIETDPDAEPLSEPIGDVTRPEDAVNTPEESANKSVDTSADKRE